MSNNIKKYIDVLIKKNEDEDLQVIIADVLEEILEEYAMDDGFGTERQSDPRGDRREGHFSMFFVEGAEDKEQKEQNKLVLQRIKDLIDEDVYFEEYLNEQEHLFEI